MKTKYIIISLILPFLFISQINAESCDKEDIARLKDLAEHVDIAYTVEEKEVDNDINKDIYTIKISNLTEEINVQGTNDDILIKENNTYSHIGPGSKKIEIYSTKCDKLLKTINFKLSYYNTYYENDVCQKYRDKIPSCKKWVKNPVKMSEITKEISKIESNEKKEELKLLKFIKNNYIYTLAALIFILITGIIIIIIKKRRNKLV